MNPKESKKLRSFGKFKISTRRVQFVFLLLFSFPFSFFLSFHCFFFFHAFSHCCRNCMNNYNRSPVRRKLPLPRCSALCAPRREENKIFQFPFREVGKGNCKYWRTLRKYSSNRILQSWYENN